MPAGSCPLSQIFFISFPLRDDSWTVTVKGCFVGSALRFSPKLINLARRRLVRNSGDGFAGHPACRKGCRRITEQWGLPDARSVLFASVALERQCDVVASGRKTGSAVHPMTPYQHLTHYDWKWMLWGRTGCRLTRNSTCGPRPAKEWCAVPHAIPEQGLHASGPNALMSRENADLIT
ncbi:hypothetical protein CALVIDRAFT_321215 [Calocera viscosa TUFC12733]|uniref:Uncharacterized protein n=1 Tax=Calocera viscosa (strain TUFC12733) TaxID=1330018 RepID=A0A167QMD8_CALVF|nr:hypothetical protein CALVIDRAFT_321215 [Calocera viscosa TUFC12733]